MVFVGYYCCHSLRGLCGLKSVTVSELAPPTVSQPARAVWIEIVTLPPTVVSLSSQPARAVWIEIPKTSSRKKTAMSQPARAVWIEIIQTDKLTSAHKVTACEGCVD